MTNPSRKDSGDGLVRVLASVLSSVTGESPVLEIEWGELVRGVANGDLGALRTLYDRTNQIVFTLAFRIVQDRQTAEEVVIAVYENLPEEAATYEPSREAVVAWLMNKVRTRALERKRPETLESPASTTLLTDSVDADDNDRGSRLARALHALTADERRVIEAVYFEGLTYSEVADRVGTPVSMIKSNLRTGLGKLSDALGTENEP